jgi:uroporphyrinogen decarboxylase
MQGAQADSVPVVPDMSNMIPARLIGKPFWDIYLYQDPPLWLAYIEAVKYFGFDGFLDYQVEVAFPDEIDINAPQWKQAIVEKTDERIVVRNYYLENGKMVWDDSVTVYLKYDPPTRIHPISKIGLSAIPEHWEPVTGIKEWPTGEELFGLAYNLMGDHGVVGMTCGTSVIVGSPEQIMEYYDNPKKTHERAEQVLVRSVQRFENIMKMEIKPDCLSCGGSGTLVFQTPDMYKELGLPITKNITALCRKAGIPSHIHSCGPERTLVEICVHETGLDVIDPLEVPPMGDCNLAQLKKEFGDKIVLKGNLHTIDVMLHGSVDKVVEESKRAIDEAGGGGRFILSTGDQCGRDTPNENILAMIETARTYGKY